MSAVSTDRRLLAELIFVAALGLVSALAFWPGMGGEFVSDDRNAIINNELVRAPLNPLAIFSEPSWWSQGRGDAPGYRPVTTLSFALNHSLDGIEPRGYHLTNLALHILVCWLIMRTASALTMTRLASMVAAALFALMPIHSEAVVWVVGRAESLASIGFLAGLLAILRYRSGGPGWLLLLSVLAMAAGLLAKESALALVAAPPLLALLIPLKGPMRRRDLWGGLALLVGLGLACWLRIGLAGHGLGAGAGDGLDNPLAGLSTAGRLAGALSVMGHYLWLLLWPHPLSADYSYNALAIGPGFIADRYSIVALVAMVAGAAAVWRTRRREPAIAFSLLMAVACYSIVSNLLLPIGTIMGERLFYLPSVGLCLALAPVLGRALETKKAAAGLLAFAVATAWTAIDIDRARDWQTPVSLFESTVAAQPNSARAHMELASAYGSADMPERALAEFDVALALHPHYLSAWYNRANMLVRQARYEEAVLSYLEAIKLGKNFEPAWFNLGLTRRLQGREAEAAEALEYAAALRAAAKVATRHDGR